MKKIRKLLFFVFMFCVAMCFHISVNAEEKEYSVLNADFYVELQENGDALVTEQWKWFESLDHW